MQAKEKQEQPINWFVLPNESYNWGLIVEKKIVENPQREVASETEGI